MRFGLPLLGCGLLIAGCSTGPAPTAASGGPLHVVAAENFWGSIASQLGGSYVDVTSIISNPNADPHDYEPTAADARTVASASLAIVNGIGYDTWASKLLSAQQSSGRVTITVGDVVGIKPGGNPHRWYSPTNVRAVIDDITLQYEKLDPTHTSQLQSLHDAFLQDKLARYFSLIDQIKQRYAGTPIGASESIVTPLAAALGLRLLTPESFLDAISEGGEPSAADKTTIDRQIAQHQIKVYVYNSQNATPDVQAQVSAARAQGIPVVSVTETLTPAGTSFEDWQVRQLQALEKALAAA